MSRECASALIATAASAPSRDSGYEASTSYGPAQDLQLRHRRGQGHASACRATAEQRRGHASIAERLAAVAAARQHAAPSPSPSPSPSPAASTAEAASPDPLSGLDMESLLSALLHPLPLGRVRNPALFSGAAPPSVQLGGSLFFDPVATLSSTLRALTVIRQVLRQDGHVLVVNPNPAMRPLLREAAHLCLNRNVWFWYRDWTPGALSDPKTGVSKALNLARCQPNRRLMAARGLPLRNPLAAARPPPPPGLSGGEYEQLVSLSRGGRAERVRRPGRAALAALLAARSAEARLLPAGSPSYASLGRPERLSLVVSLDLSYGGDAVREAHARNIPCVSLLNGHSDASCVTFPVYASEAHAGFQHFFLDWLLRLVNVRPEAAAAAAAAAAGLGQQAR